MAKKTSPRKATKFKGLKTGPAADTYFEKFMSSSKRSLNGILTMFRARFRDDPKTFAALGLLVAEADHPVIEALPEHYRPQGSGHDVVVVPMKVVELREILLGLGVKSSWSESLLEDAVPGVAIMRVEGRTLVRPFSVEKGGAGGLPSEHRLGEEEGRGTAADSEPPHRSGVAMSRRETSPSLESMTSTRTRARSACPRPRTRRCSQRSLRKSTRGEFAR
jgi:hypothetical protein